MVTRTRLALAAATVAFACASGACVVVFGMDPLSEKAGATDSGPSDAGTSDANDADFVDACGVDDIGAIGKPEPTASPSDAGSLYFAFTLLDLGIDGNAERPGHDLDRRVTVDRGTSSCTFMEGTDTALQYGADTPAGVDNVTFGLLQALRGFVAAFDPVRFNGRLVDSIYGVVVRLDRWNGAENDDDVSVFVFPTIGYWRKAADGGLVAGGERSAPFNPDAGHLWVPDARFRAGTIGSSISSDAAWINGGKLVARFGRMTLPLRSSVDELRSFDIELRDAWMTATLAPEAGTLSDGTISGRIPSGAFLEQVKLMYDESSGSYVCAKVQDNLGLLCAARDIRASHCDDGRGSPCDALSFGARFEAQRAGELGPFRARTDDEYRAAGQLPPSERCADAGDLAPIDCPR